MLLLILKMKFCIYEVRLHWLHYSHGDPYILSIKIIFYYLILFAYSYFLYRKNGKGWPPLICHKWWDYILKLEQLQIFVKLANLPTILVPINFVDRICMNSFSCLSMFTTHFYELSLENMGNLYYALPSVTRALYFFLEIPYCLCEVLYGIPEFNCWKPAQN